MILYRKESDVLQQELEALLMKKEEEMAALSQQKVALESGREKTLLAIGQEAYQQYLNNSNECDLLAYFENVQAVEGRLAEKEAQILQAEQSYANEIETLQGRIAASAAPVAPVQPAAVPEEAPAAPEEAMLEEAELEGLLGAPGASSVQLLAELEALLTPEEAPVLAISEEAPAAPAPFAPFVISDGIDFSSDEEPTVVLDANRFTIPKAPVCKNCGKVLQEGDCFCDQCGTRVL